MPDDGDYSVEHETRWVRMSALSIQSNLQKMREREIEIFCEDCGEEIPEKRRKAMPGCTRCIRCQMKLEEYQSRARSNHEIWK